MCISLSDTLFEDGVYGNGKDGDMSCFERHAGAEVNSSSELSHSSLDMYALLMYLTLRQWQIISMLKFEVSGYFV